MPYRIAGIGMGMGKIIILLKGSNKMLANTIAETPPEAPTELYQWLSFCLTRVVDEAIIIADK